MVFAKSPNKINDAARFISNVGIHQSRVNRIGVKSKPRIAAVQSFCEQNIAQLQLFIVRIVSKPMPEVAPVTTIVSIFPPKFAT